MKARATVEPIAYGGWDHNLRLSNGEVEVVVTLDVGPRIIRYAPIGGPNLLKEVAAELGRSGEPTWKMRGGHRLWVSPEEPGRTYVPDNAPTTYAVEDRCVRATATADTRHGIERTMEVTLADTGSEVTVVHQLRNLGAAATELAAWALTVMAPGGVAILPLPPNGPHPGAAAQSAKDFAPHLSLVLWPYFRFDDPRVTFGRSCVRLRQDPNATGPTKLGLSQRAGLAAYWNQGLLFVKRFGHEEGARYPDRGCNFETYTDGDMLELETLGPLVQLPPGGETTHIERWSLLHDVPAPTTDEIVDRAIFPRIS